jgi:GNAT superfamily N-acetyltransferase
MMSEITFEPLTSERWADFEAVFGPRGATGGCWCMWMRLKNKDFEAQQGEGNRQAMRAIVDSDEIPGILAYVDGQPMAWCSLGPRERFSRLSRSRILKPVDDQPVWSVVCFFVTKPFRRQGLMKALLKAAVDYAVSRGAAIIEGYPVEPKQDQMPDAFAWTGLAAAFRDVGFKEVARRSEARPIMRYVVEE